MNDVHASIFCKAASIYHTCVQYVTYFCRYSIISKSECGVIRAAHCIRSLERITYRGMYVRVNS
jgi:hypothetical protein